MLIHEFCLFCELSTPPLISTKFKCLSIHDLFFVPDKTYWTIDDFFALLSGTLLSTWALKTDNVYIFVHVSANEWMLLRIHYSSDPVWAAGQILSHVLWINNIKKGLVRGSLFPRDKCGWKSERLKKEEKKKKKPGGRILMFGLGDNWQDVGCCLRTFMQERLFGPRHDIYICMSLMLHFGWFTCRDWGQLCKSSPKQAERITTHYWLDYYAVSVADNMIQTHTLCAH